MFRDFIALLAVVVGMLFILSVLKADAGRHSVDLRPPTIVASLFAGQNADR
jgi:hypothetical protein